MNVYELDIIYALKILLVDLEFYYLIKKRRLQTAEKKRPGTLCCVLGQDT